MRFAWIAVFAAFASFAPSARAQETPSLEAAPRGDAPVRIDGALDEPVWSTAPVGAHFTERTPHPGAPSPVETEVRVLYDRDALYVGIVAHTLPGEQPRALELRRDNNAIFDDDSVSLKLDVRRDHRTTLGFVVTPAGVQLDYIALDNGRVFRRELDLVWESAAQQGTDRWTVELRVPVAALGLARAEGERVLGFEVTRDHNARIATDDWAPLPPEFGPFSALHYGTLRGLRDLGGGSPLVLVPYVALSHRSPRDILFGPFFGPDAFLYANAGGELQARLSEDLWGEATVRTDFAQVDLDDPQVNVDRFPLFFPERRPFFLTGADVFEFGEPQLAQLYFSRRIGLDGRRRVVPIAFGAKVYGRVGNVSLGLLDVVTESSIDQPAANFAVARVRYNAGTASYVGAMATTRIGLPFGARDARGEPLPSDPSWSAGLDGLARFAGDRMEIYGFASVAGTDRDARPEGAPADDARDLLGGAGRAAVRYRGEEWTPQLSALLVSRDFAPSVGFVRRAGIFQTRLDIPWVYRRAGGDFRTLELSGYGELTLSDDVSRGLGARAGWSAASSLASNFYASLGADYVEDVVVAPFELFPGVRIEPGDYRGAVGRAYVSTPTQRNPSGALSYSVSNAFFGGVLHQTSASFDVAFGPHLRVNALGTWNHAEPRGTAAIDAVTTAATVTVAPMVGLEGSAVLQLNTLTDAMTALIRIRWRYAPGSDLFVVYREDLALDRADVSVGRSVTLKLTYRIDALL